jgi:NIPSNAP protein
MKRREFLNRSLTLTALAGLGPLALRATAADAASPQRECYELRRYRLKADTNTDLLHAYLEKAALPALNRLGAGSIGVFTELEPKDAPAIHVLIPYASLEVLAATPAKLNADPEYQKAGADYLHRPKANPVFERIESSVFLAFAAMPKLELPAYSKAKQPRIFEIRTYESYSEDKAQKKVDMFNDGEMNVMRETKMGPVFFGQALAGANLPQLTYMLSAESRAAHTQHWAEFSKHPVWNRMKNDPQYADTVSKITNWFLAPTAYSQI